MALGRSGSRDSRAIASATSDFGATYRYFLGSFLNLYSRIYMCKNPHLNCSG
jgi:hypothetical protein